MQVGSLTKINEPTDSMASPSSYKNKAKNMDNYSWTHFIKSHSSKKLYHHQAIPKK